MAYNLSNLRPAPGSTRDRKRLGRGPGSSLGKTSGRGHKGQMSRSGAPRNKPWHEGGQMPIQRRLPKRGFTNPNRKVYQIVNLRDMQRLSDTQVVSPVELKAARLIRDEFSPVKILGVGEPAAAWTVRADAFSASARGKIEAAGGRVEVLG
jgi:large subunit ribosomal protein L15